MMFNFLQCIQYRRRNVDYKASRFYYIYNKVAIHIQNFSENML